MMAGGGNWFRQAAEKTAAPVVFYRGTVPGETARIDEPFEAAKGRTFAARTESAARNYGRSIERIEARPWARILFDEDPSFWRLVRRRRPPNGFIGSALRPGESIVEAVNDAIRKAESAGYDIISFSSDADIGTVILNEDAVIRQVKEKSVATAAKEAARLSAPAGWLAKYAQDDAYMQAVESRDMATAQRMVEEAAKRAGYKVRAWHGSASRFTSFDYERIYSGEGYSQSGSGFYFTDSPESARLYAQNADKTGRGGVVYSVYLAVSNPVTVDFSTGEVGGMAVNLSKEDVRRIILSAPDVRDPDGPLSNFGDIRFEGFDKVLSEAVETYLYPESIPALRNDFYMYRGNHLDKWLETLRKITKHDGAVSRTMKGDTHYVVWRPSQIKSADPVTRDDSGQVIPLSRRFDPTNPDIRF